MCTRNHLKILSRVAVTNRWRYIKGKRYKVSNLKRHYYYTSFLSLSNTDTQTHTHSHTHIRAFPYTRNIAQLENELPLYKNNHPSVQIVVAAVLLNPNHWRKHPAIVPEVGPYSAGIAILVPGCSCRFRRLLLVQVVPELFYAGPGKHTKHSSLVFIELYGAGQSQRRLHTKRGRLIKLTFWRGPAELGILGFPVECLDSGQREMGQALTVIDEVVDALQQGNGQCGGRGDRERGGAGHTSTVRCMQ